ncbi:S9 family peptidase [Myxococcota bacterium]|nr:S9 family peptidase [Myxococcota bacterium]
MQKHYSERGCAPVGVTTLELVDDSRQGRVLPLEVWYPADEVHRGQDLEESTQDRFDVVEGVLSLSQRAARDAQPSAARSPLVVFSHGATSHRRASSEMATHLASHGYVVASADHVGNTMADLIHDVMMGGREGGDTRMVDLTQSAWDRPRDVVQTLDALLGDGNRPRIGSLDEERIGVCGVSFGGWTTLAVNSMDPRPKASFPIVPAWGPGPLKTEQLSALLRLDDWGRSVPTFLLAAELDALILLSSLRDLHEELRPPKRMSVLRNAGHVHFGDGAERRHEELRSMWSSGQLPMDDPEIDFAAVAEASRPFSELCPAAHGAEVAQALCLAHMDAHLKDDADALAWLEGDLASHFSARGIDLEVV